MRILKSGEDILHNVREEDAYYSETSFQDSLCATILLINGQVQSNGPTESIFSCRNSVLLKINIIEKNDIADTGCVIVNC